MTKLLMSDAEAGFVENGDISSPRPEKTLGGRHMTYTLALEMNAWLSVLVVNMCCQCSIFYPIKF